MIIILFYFFVLALGRACPAPGARPRMGTSLILFAARSTEGIKRLSKSERASINIPDEVKEILIGILLGDARCGSFHSSHTLLIIERLILRVFFCF